MNIFDKTLYLQRLIYAQGQAMKHLRTDDERRSVIGCLSKQAEQEIDNAIASHTQILEICGVIPTVREV